MSYYTHISNVFFPVPPIFVADMNQQLERAPTEKVALFMEKLLNGGVFLVDGKLNFAAQSKQIESIEYDKVYATPPEAVGGRCYAVVVGGDKERVYYSIFRDLTPNPNSAWKALTPLDQKVYATSFKTFKKNVLSLYGRASL